LAAQGVLALSGHILIHLRQALQHQLEIPTGELSVMAPLQAGAPQTGSSQEMG
jgi:hypothetical protein